MLDYHKYLEDQKNDEILWIPNLKEIIFKYCRDIESKLGNAKVNSMLDIGCREFFTYDYFKDKVRQIVGVDINRRPFNIVLKNQSLLLN